MKGGVVCDLSVIDNDDLPSDELLESSIRPMSNLGNAGAGNTHAGTSKLTRIDSSLLAGVLDCRVQGLAGHVLANLLDLDCVSDASPKDLAFVPDHTFGLGSATVNSQKEGHGVFLSCIFLRVSGIR